MRMRLWALYLVVVSASNSLFFSLSKFNLQNNLIISEVSYGV